MLKKILITLLILIILGGAGFGAWYFHDMKINELIEAYDAEIMYLHTLIEEPMPTVTVYTVARNVRRNDILRVEDLTLMQIPVQSNTDAWIVRNSPTDDEVFSNMYWRLDLRPGAIITFDMIMSEYVDNTSRYYPIMLDVLPVGLRVGDYIDVRVIFPRGENLRVLSRRRVIDIIGNVVYTNLTEVEIQWLHGAYDDLALWKTHGMKLYATLFIDPGFQSSSPVFYSVPRHIANAINFNPSIIDSGNMSANNRARDVLDSILMSTDEEMVPYLIQTRESQFSILQQSYYEWLSRVEIEIEEESYQWDDDWDSEGNWSGGWD